VLSQYFIADEAATQRQPDDKQSLTRCHSSVRVTEGCVFGTPFEAKEKRTQATRCGRAFEVPFGTHFLHPRIRGVSGRGTSTRRATIRSCGLRPNFRRSTPGFRSPSSLHSANACRGPALL